ncbi:MAG: metallophosphoesterase, partial [Cyanobacteria bacterium KgW148]|nr:metallophosphoesterase [Cyanobacteria bacterium KgW148]
MNRRRFIFFSVVSGCSVALGAAIARRLTSPKPRIVPSASPATEPSPGVPKRSGNPAPPGMYAPPRGDVRIAVISDLNSQYGSTTYEPEVIKAVELIPQWEPDL